MYGPGTVLAGRYRLDERIGGGGMGDVWRATDQVLERTVAVKMMRQELVEERGFAERFLTEARTMAAIKHPGVVAVHDYRGDEAGAFLVMEYVEGEALSRRLHRFGSLDPVRAMRLLAQAAEALHAAHEKGVVHRDIKPGNLLVTAADTVVLTDFGIARSAASTPLTATGAVVGTPSYLAPEQVLGRPATARSDVYALGVVAYECLAGKRPFEGDNPFEVAMKRLRESAPPLPEQIPPAVRAVVERTLTADPEQRWQTAAELAAAARHASSPTGSATGSPSGSAATGAAATRSATTTAPAPGPVSPPAPAPGSGAGSVSPPEFAPARVPIPPPVPTSLPVPPPAPTKLEHRAAIAPPGSPPASPPPAGPASPVPAHLPAPAPGTPMPGPVPPGTPMPPPWAPPVRPAVVSVASLLLLVAAGALVLYFGGSLRALGRYVEVYERYLAQYGDGSAAEAATAVGALGAIVAGAGVVVAVVLALLSWPTYLGKRAARGWALWLGGILLCCCAPPIAVDYFGDGLGSFGTNQIDREEINRQVLEAMPGWYEPLTGPVPMFGLATLLVSLFLLNLPSAVRYFRRPRPLPYYPYHPYYPYYGYPPPR